MEIEKCVFCDSCGKKIIYGKRVYICKDSRKKYCSTKCYIEEYADINIVNDTLVTQNNYEIFESVISSVGNSLFDLRMEKYGKLTPVKVIGKDKHGKTLWECLCDCGNTCTATVNALRKGDKKSCGCLATLSSISIGDRIGNLVVLDKIGYKIFPSGRKVMQWLCKCDCGNEKIINSDNLTRGIVKNCGCIKNKEKEKRVCSSCGNLNYYAKGLCKNCYTKQFRKKKKN